MNVFRPTNLRLNPRQEACLIASFVNQGGLARKPSFTFWGRSLLRWWTPSKSTYSIVVRWTWLENSSLRCGASNLRTVIIIVQMIQLLVWVLVTLKKSKTTIFQIPKCTVSTLLAFWIYGYILSPMIITGDELTKRKIPQSFRIGRRVV